MERPYTLLWQEEDEEYDVDDDLQINGGDEELKSIEEKTHNHPLMGSDDLEDLISEVVSSSSMTPPSSSASLSLESLDLGGKQLDTSYPSDDDVFLTATAVPTNHRERLHSVDDDELEL